MTTLDERIAACEAELSRLRAERDAEPRRWWINVYPSGYYGLHSLRETAENAAAPHCETVPVIELRPGWKLVRDEPAPFVVTDALCAELEGYSHAVDTYILEVDADDRRSNRIRTANAITRAGIPAVAEGVGS